MTVEKRLLDALQTADGVNPSPDLFTRVERSLEEDLAFRRRRLVLVLLAFTVAVVGTAWVWMSVRQTTEGSWEVETWRMVILELAIVGLIVLALAPHIRRFARSFVDEVFYLQPATGGRFLTALDVAYYVGFTGLALVDADLWELGATVGLSSSLEGLAGRIGFVTFVMGLLHAANIALLPILGLVYNSRVRSELRGRAGLDAPEESLRARAAASNARSFALGLVVLALAILVSLVLSPLRVLVTGLV